VRREKDDRCVGSVPAPRRRSFPPNQTCSRRVRTWKRSGTKVACSTKQSASQGPVNWKSLGRRLRERFKRTATKGLASQNPTVEPADRASTPACRWASSRAHSENRANPIRCAHQSPLSKPPQVRHVKRGAGPEAKEPKQSSHPRPHRSGDPPECAAQRFQCLDRALRATKPSSIRQDPARI